MKMQFTLNDETIDLVIAQLRTVLEGGSFIYRGEKYSAGNLSDVRGLASKEKGDNKRAMITFNGKSMFSTIIFYEGDTIISYDTDRLVVKGKMEMEFTKTTLTEYEAERIKRAEQEHQSYVNAYWKDVEAEWDKMMNA